MKHAVIVVDHIALGLITSVRKIILAKPIHFIAITFFTMLVVYATTSLLPIIGECAEIVKSHMNLDAMQF
ncbi:hypothetical protein [Paenisporosarcina indica]|uniref:hypothetical protein n=1 Tax=Paenisporosarcina indica TaxID=650093 RepID=UPI0009501550|nr:hypothetical protein [Paenisporosarcina indica]